MADIQSALEDTLPNSFGKLALNLLSSEKSLIKLREALPIEKQEDFTRQIQTLSKARISFLTSIQNQTPFLFDDNLATLADLQGKYNACLDLVANEIVEEGESIEMKQGETALNVIKRRSNTVKGMITGNFNETLETMDRILAIGENLIVQGYQKLFIDSPSMKDKLQSVIDERQNLPSCSKPLETLILKQKFSEKQLTCLLTLLEEANTLSDLITKLQEFDKRQIQFQQASQVTIDAMKKFFYKPEIRKTNERRRTYLSVSYADPSNPREGLDILRDQINSVIRNLNNLCDMEDAKVRTVKKSDLGDECEKAYDEVQQLFEEEKENLKKTLGILVSIEDNQVDLEKCDKFIDEFVLPEESPQGQLDFIKFFVTFGSKQPRQRLTLSRLLLDLVTRFDQDHSTYSSLVDKLQSEVNDLTAENAQLKAQAQGRVIEKFSEGPHSLKELIELQDHLKNSIQESLEGQFRKQLSDVLMISSGISEILLGINPDEDLRLRLNEFDNEFLRTNSLAEVVDLVTRFQSYLFRLVSKLGKIGDGFIHTNIVNLKKSKNLSEARENISGKPAEYPLAAMDRVLSEILRNYMGSLDDRRGNIDAVLKKQEVITKLLRDYKN